MSVTSMDRTVSQDGISLAAPEGWTTEAFTNKNGMLVFRLGNFQFPPAASDDVGQTARAAMQDGDVLVNLVDVTATDPTDQNHGYEVVTTPLYVTPEQAVAQEGYEVPSAIIRGVRMGSRSFYLSVSFGNLTPSKEQIDAVNAVLASLIIS